jgi:predicted O-methyltransferase YrrM
MNIFQKIEDIHSQISGWCSKEKAMTLASIVLANRHEISLEVGVWYGKSLLPVALMHQHLGQGKVIAVDPWHSGCSVAGQVNPQDAEWWNRQDIHEVAYRAFDARVRSLELQKFVEVHRMHSDEFDPPQNIGLLSVDGNHGDQAIKDVQRYAPMVKRGGFLVADDLNWTGGSVLRAVELLPDLGFIERYKVVNSQENWAVFQRL